MLCEIDGLPPALRTSVWSFLFWKTTFVIVSWWKFDHLSHCLIGLVAGRMGSVSSRESKGPIFSNYVQNSVIANKIELVLSVEDFFNLFWKDKDSLFYQDFLTSLKCFDVNIEPWWLQESTYTIHRNIHSKHKNNAKFSSHTDAVCTVKEQTITYNPQDKELTIKEIVTYQQAPYCDKFKIFVTWSVMEISSELIQNVSAISINISSHMSTVVLLHVFVLPSCWCCAASEL